MSIPKGREDERERLAEALDLSSCISRQQLLNKCEELEMRLGDVGGKDACADEEDNLHSKYLYLVRCLDPEPKQYNQYVVCAGSVDEAYEQVLRVDPDIIQGNVERLWPVSDCRNPGIIVSALTNEEMLG